MEKQILKACDEFNCRLYLLEGDQNKLKVYVDKMKENIDLLECEKISKRISFFLMAEDLKSHLEVSSPGINRKLKYPWHFKEVLGRKIQLTVLFPIKGKNHFVGLLKQVEKEFLVMESESTIWKIYFCDIKKARLCFEF